MARSEQNEKKIRKRTVMAHLRIVKRFLQEWDPIEVIGDQVEAGVAPTEYDSYAPGVLGMLRRGCSAAELAEHLASLRTKRMGLRRDDAKDARIAEGLIHWWRESSPRIRARADDAGGLDLFH